ncbi:MAG: hypothetical protein ACP5VE_15300 [Chthonomonadales bacterium]
MSDLTHPIGPIMLMAAWLLLVTAATPVVLKRARLVRKNFLGRRVPVALGWAVILWACTLLAWDPWRLWTVRERAAFCAVLLGFGTLGFVDDLRGDRTATGLRGHFRRLIADHRVTTGLLKATGIPVLSLIIVWGVLGRPAFAGFWDALIISLSANGLNLLDLRPGRACAAFLVLGALLVSGALAHNHAPPLLVVLIAAAAIYPLDASARAMLGDTGSNALGGVLALQLVLANPGWPARWIAAILLVLLHFAAEKYSLSALIEAQPILRRLDRLTGRRNGGGLHVATDDEARK